MISVIVPVYNVKEDYLRECVSSILHQDYSEIELILVDDGSTNGVGVICDEYSKNDVRVKVVHQENQGVSVARNNGMKASAGEWLCFVDADDWIEESTFSTVLCAIKEKAPDMVVWNLFRDIDRDMSVEKNLGTSIYLKTEDEMDKVCIRLLQVFSTRDSEGYDISTLVYPFCHLYRRELIERNCVYFDASFKQGEDKLFNYQYMKYAQNILYLNEALYHYRIHTQSVSHTFFSEHVDNSTQIMNKYLEIEPRVCYDERYRSAFSLRGGYVALLLLNNYYLHPDSTVMKPMKEFRNLMNQEPYRCTIKDMDISKLKDSKAKLKMWMLKWHCYLPLFLYIRIKNRILVLRNGT